MMNRFSDKLNRLLRPKTIAVIGGHFAQAVAKQCDKMGFGGDIWPVHPSRAQIEGRSCFKDLHSLPASPDATFIGVNRHQTIEMVRQLNQLGAGGSVCYASGFKETGDDTLNQLLIDTAGNMPVLGPNCYGFINYLDGALLWPDQHGGRRVNSGVAILMQSSNIAINLTMNKRATPIAYMIALGNQAMVGMSDMIIQLCQDDRVTAIGLHIEAIDDISRFCQAIGIAHQYNKPVVILKTGKSAKGAAITLTHTASLASDDKVTDALFERLSVARVDSIAQFLEALKVLHLFGALPGNDMVSMSCSGGEASLISDASEHYDVEFKDFSETDIERIKPTVHELVSISNPFDYHTFDWANYDRLEASFSAVMASGFTLNALIMDFPRQDRCEIAEWRTSLAAWHSAAQQTDSRTAIIASLSESMPEDIAQELLAKNIVPLCGVENALAAIEAATMINTQQTAFEPLTTQQFADGKINTLNEFESKQKLAAFSIPLAPSALCHDYKEAVEFSSEIGYPVVVKAVGDQFAHKTELGLVKLNIADDQALQTAVEEIKHHAAVVLVEKMVSEVAVELIIGVNRDPVIGLYLVIGAGGIYAELLKDTQIVLFPYDQVQIEKAIAKLRLSALLDGYRNQSPIDKSLLLQAIMNVQEFVIENKDTLMEMDINPLIVCKDGKVYTADALIRCIQS